MLLVYRLTFPSKSAPSINGWSSFFSIITIKAVLHQTSYPHANVANMLSSNLGLDNTLVKSANKLL